MKINQLYFWCSKELEFTDCGDFEALCLFNDVLGYSKEQIYLKQIDATEEDVINSLGGIEAMIYDLKVRKAIELMKPVEKQEK